MNDELFAELMTSIEEAGQIARREVAAARTFTVEREPLDVKRIREGYNLSQTRFAAVLLGISVKTLRNWEQSRRSPAGPAARSAPGRRPSPRCRVGCRARRCSRRRMT